METVVVPRLWPESTVVCIGGGPSLTPDDVAWVRDRARVVAVNDAYRLAPWADVLYAADERWWAHHRGVPGFSGLKYTLQREAARWPGVQALRNTGELGLETAPSGLRHGRNSGYQAIGVAVHLGATRILLLGYDMQAIHGKGHSHWFGQHPPRLRASSPYASFVTCYQSLPAALAALGVTVINCSRETALTCFPRATLAAALKKSEVAA